MGGATGSDRPTGLSAGTAIASAHRTTISLPSCHPGYLSASAAAAASTTASSISPHDAASCRMRMLQRTWMVGKPAAPTT